MSALDAQQQTLPLQICLTFDDGPSAATTPRLLDDLARFGVKATFFVVGQKLATGEGAAIVERMAAEGHQIGNHGFSHRRMTELYSEEIESEIQQTAALIGPLDNGVKLFRPPFGVRNADVDRAVVALGYRLVLWNVTSEDWHQSRQDGSWVPFVLGQVAERQSSIVLAHDTLPTTVDHVGALIEAIRAQSNAQFVRITS